MNLQTMHQSRGGGRPQAALISVLFVGICSACLNAETPAAFKAPMAYPIQRYEAGWNKNPFTLKTALVVAEQASFAKDLAIAAYYGDAQDPTVVVVNTKTGERTQLRKTQPAASGMQMKSVQLGSRRKDMVVELTFGTETSEVRFNDDYMKQMASAGSTQAAPGTPNHPPAALPPKAPAPAAHPMKQASPPVTQQGSSSKVPAAKPNRPLLKPGGTGAAMAAGNKTTSPMNPRASPGNSTTSPGVTPVLSGRRFNSPISINPRRAQ